MFDGLLLGGTGIGFRIVDPAEDRDALCPYFDTLALPRRLHQLTTDNDGATGGQVQDLRFVIRQRLVGNHLNGIEA